MKKLISILLSVIMIVSAFTCLAVVNADGTADSLEVAVVEKNDAKFVEVTYESRAPFMVALLEFEVSGVTITDTDGIIDSYVADGGNNGKNVPSAETSPISEGKFKLLIQPADALVLAQYTKVVVDIPVTISAQSEFSVKPTKAQAAASKDEDGKPEDFIEISFTGENDTIADDAPGVTVEETASHTHNYVLVNTNPEGHYMACECGAIDPKNPLTAHTFTYKQVEGKETHIGTCSCGFATEEAECVDTDPKDDKCDVCDGDLEPEGPEKFNVTYQRTLELQSKILVNVWVLEDTMKALGATTSNTTMLFSKATAPDADPIEVKPVIGMNGGNRYFRFSYSGLVARELGVEFSYYMNVRTGDDDTVTKVSNVGTYKVVDYIKTTLTNNENTTDTKKQKLNVVLANIANYGAAAQINFGSDLTLVNKWDSEVERLVNKFATVADPTVALAPDATGTGLVINTTLELTAEVKINFLVNKAQLNAKISELSASNDDVKFVVTYIDSSTGSKTTQEFAYGDLTTYMSGSTPYYRASFDKYVARQFREIATCEVFIGTTKVSQTKQMSMEGYTASVANSGKNPNLIALTKAMMKYGDSAAAYFS